MQLPAPPCARSSFAVALLATLAATAAACAGGRPQPTTRPRPSCPAAPAGSVYKTRVFAALRAGRDVWGEQLLARRGGPTYAAARRFLAPLVLAGAPGKRLLTASGVHYVAFSLPPGEGGADGFRLHVADGSQIVARRVGGASLTAFSGRERYGSCRGRLTSVRLADGWLPILRTTYRDGSGNRLEQESFAWPLTPGGRFASFVRLSVAASQQVTIGLVAHDGAVRLRVMKGTTATLYAAWPTRAAPRVVSKAAYEEARAAVVAAWNRRLAPGASIEVPEPIVMNAERAVLTQSLAFTWRYSIGNPYEEFSFPESVDIAQVLAEWGYHGSSRAVLETSLTRSSTPYGNWKMGERLLASAVYYRLVRDRDYVQHATPVLRRYMEALRAQILAGPRGLLRPERYSSDIPDQVLGLHSQAVAWEGLRAMGDVWRATGRAALARDSRAAADRLERGLRRAVGASQRRLPDGSLFVPISLLERERPYASVTETRLGSYWNLVMPYALASGLFRPDGPRARGIYRYLRLHGSRLLGLVRAGAYALYPSPRFPTGGTDEVYGINAARFLADNGLADQLVLSLYGQLAAAMTPGTFVGGEAATVAPLRGRLERTAYLPPNAASNAAFLTKLRLAVVHETRTPGGEPSGLQLGYATPRAWLEPGKRVAVRRMPTTFGHLGFELEAQPGAVHVAVDIPGREAPPRLTLRLRLPAGERVLSVSRDGRPYRRLDRSGTIDLTGLRGRVVLVAATSRG